VLILSISQSDNLLEFSRTTISRVSKEWCEKGKKNIQYAAVLWMKIPCWCERSEENGRLIQAERRAT